MYKTMLLPTDGSSCSQLAVEHALQLAKTLESRVIFLNVVENPLAIYAMPETLSYNQELYGTLKQQGQDVLHKAKTLADTYGVASEIKLIEQQNPIDAILEQAEACDLIVMGTHGRRGFDRWVLGSVTEAVLRRTNKPCLIIHHNDKS